MDIEELKSTVDESINKIRGDMTQLQMWWIENKLSDLYYDEDSSKFLLSNEEAWWYLQAGVDAIIGMIQGNMEAPSQYGYIWIPGCGDNPAGCAEDGYWRKDGNSSL